MFKLEGSTSRSRPVFVVAVPLWRRRRSVLGLWTVGQVGPSWVPSLHPRLRKRNRTLNRHRLRQGIRRKIRQVRQVAWARGSMGPSGVALGPSPPPFHTPGSSQEQAIRLERVVSRVMPDRPSAVRTSAVRRRRPPEARPGGAEWASIRPLPPCSPHPATQRIATSGLLPA